MYIAYPIVNHFLSKGFAREDDAASNLEYKAVDYEVGNFEDKQSWAALSSSSGSEGGEHVSGCSLSNSSISDSERDDNPYSKPAHAAADGIGSQNSDVSHCDHDDDDGYVLTAFASPGCHQIIIYDPRSQEYFRKSQIINYRNDNPRPCVAHQAKLPAHLLTSPSLQRQKELPPNSIGKIEHHQAQRELFPTKPTVASHGPIIAHSQQPDFSQQIFEEEKGLYDATLRDSGIPADLSSHIEVKVKQALRKNYEFMVNLHQLLSIQGSLKEFLKDIAVDVPTEE